MRPDFRIAPVLLAGFLTASLQGCAKDLPTESSDEVAATAFQKAGARKPSNDLFNRAVVIRTLPFTDTVNTTRATVSKDDPLGSQNCGTHGQTVWYKFTPSRNMQVHLNTVRSRGFFPTSYDPVTGIYSGERRQLTLSGCTDESYGVLAFTALAGRTYFIEVGSPENQAGGNLIFTLVESLQVSIAIDSEGSLDPSTGFATVRGTLTCSRSTFYEFGGSVRQTTATAGSFFISSDCNGVTPWEAEVESDGPLAAGQVEVSAGGLFTDNFTTQEIFVGPVTATVALR